MKKLSALLGVLLLAGFLSLVASPAHAACVTRSVSHSATYDMDGDDELVRNVRFVRSLTYRDCGSYTVIDRLGMSAFPSSGTCSRVARSFEVNPTSIAGVNPPTKTFACAGGGSGVSWTPGARITGATNDRVGDFTIRADRAGLTDWSRAGILAYSG